MIGKGTELQQFLADEVNQYKGIAVPVFASPLRCLLTRKLPVSKLHPNPDDEFCFPDIGPNMGIISDYEKEYRRFGNDMQGAQMAGSGISEPIQVQRIQPGGYMILNGHHRWIAAMRAGIKKIPVKLVNITQHTDIRNLLSGVHNSKRVALDLDEVVFAAPGEPAEKPLRFPLNRLYPQPLRLGIPSLFYYLSAHRYDIWVYTSRLVSYDEILRLFRHHHAGPVFVVTGAGGKGAGDREKKAQLEKMIFEKYPVTYHIDQKSVLKIDSATREFEEFPLPGKTSWSREVQDVFRKQDANG